jgi:hypothetical protein
MIKKIIICILTLCLLLVLVSCGRNKDNRFEKVYFDSGYNQGMGGIVYYRDTQTDVIYFNIGHGISPLLNSDGTPMLYEEFLEQIG